MFLTHLWGTAAGRPPLSVQILSVRVPCGRPFAQADRISARVPVEVRAFFSARVLSCWSSAGLSPAPPRRRPVPRVARP